MKPDRVIENDPRAEEAIRRWDELKQRRVRHETIWEDIARLIRPQRGGFSMTDHVDRDMERPLSSGPAMASTSFASGIYAGITNPANRWGGLETPDPDFNNWKPMAEWNDFATRAVMTSFGPSMSSFYRATFQGYSDIAAFGQFAAYDEFVTDERKFMDETLSLAEVVVEIDWYGRVVEVVRKTMGTARQITRQFKGQVPAKIAELAEKGATDRLAVYQHVLLNEDFRKGAFSVRGKRYLSRHVTEEGKALLRESGYNEMPFYFPRWDVDSGETYGTGPGFIALPSARLHHLMHAATIRAAQYAADPTKLVPHRDDWQIHGRIAPGQLVAGGLNPMTGRKMIETLDTTGNIGITEAEKAKVLEEVKDAFHYTIMSLQGRTGLTSEETQIIEEAKLRNWAPHADRIMEEYGARKVERRFQMLWRLGQIPPPPKEAQGIPLQVRYQSAATMAMSAREGQAVRQFLADLTPLTQLDPRYADRLDPDGITEALHDASPSLPATILRSRKDADALAQQRAQAQQATQMLDMLGQGAGAAKDLAAAGLPMGPGGEGMPQ
ncbi:MAG: hypothetical protein KDK11_10275 [Maritimibacter sp.]|nr:hypothetical protein [Maritimibacter sp.]